MPVREAPKELCSYILYIYLRVSAGVFLCWVCKFRLCSLGTPDHGEGWVTNLNTVAWPGCVNGNVNGLLCLCANAGATLPLVLTPLYSSHCNWCFYTGKSGQCQLLWGTARAYMEKSKVWVVGNIIKKINALINRDAWQIRCSTVINNFTLLLSNTDVKHC